jgi:hypothetical protein
MPLTLVLYVPTDVDPDYRTQHDDKRAEPTVTDCPSCADSG